jgi:hypothetical protein
VKPKPRIKSNDAGGYTVTIPAFGFGQPEQRAFPTHRDAAAWLRSIQERRGSGSHSRSDRSHHLHDGISPVPVWYPYRRYGWS